MDRRDYSAQVLTNLDSRRMTAIFETDEGVDEVVRVRFEVCPVCEGAGTHVNPNIDRHGISADDFADDEDFAEQYRAGVYDVICHECRGAKVVPEPDPDLNPVALVAAIAERVQAQYADAAEEAAELRAMYGPEY